ncbi:hypothetical protein HOP50_04g30020 [Chloropicon primus]|uniref:EF-hand domain-containing protein n=2 Tax=Chloropicon primus TaxID=1764295 RepID=A0A5B8MK80_9CHLO|nr:hypothetical protein A3770_04p30020 [Chloropicon primus]UPQ99694.1 hypothetical protein HOP50_04g30020 [Chloropicon primus]|eukprot:QDZ20484.1 hypothetical protein A3770_04p30020 [Chloropicon primus]
MSDHFFAVVALIAAISSLLSSSWCLAQEDGGAPTRGGERSLGWNVPLEPQTGLLDSNGTGKAKYIKKVIWVDEIEAVTGEDVSVTPRVSDLRSALGDKLLGALAGGQLARAESAPGDAITLSRDVLPLLLQDASPDDDGGQQGIGIGPAVVGDPKGSSPSYGVTNAQLKTLDLEDLLRRKQREQQGEADLSSHLSYASASTTKSYEEHRPSFAFDGDVSTVWMSRPWTAEEGKPQWIEYSFQEPRPVRGYSLSSYPASPPPRGSSEGEDGQVNLAALGGAVFGGPTSWALKCSENGLDWTVLHSRKGAQPWIPGERRQVQIPRDKSRRLWNYCRVYVYEVPKRPDGKMQTAIGEITFQPPLVSEAARGPQDLQKVTSIRIPVEGKRTKSAEMARGAAKLRAMPQRALVQVPKKVCSFPFVHNGAPQHACISFQDQDWCKTREDEWLVCDGQQGAGGSGSQNSVRRQSRADPLDQVEARPLLAPAGEAQTRRYNIEARQCKFPFLHFGSLHNDCVSFQGQRWCKDHGDRWLTCPDSQAGGRVPEATAGDSGGKDWVLSLKALRTDQSPDLNVLEMKPQGGPEDGGAVEYEVCKIVNSPDFKLYIPPRYTRLPLGDDEAARVKLPQGFAFPFYGKEYEEMFVGSNGYITFDVADTNFLPSEESHSQKKRISVLFADIDASQSGEVQFADLKTAVAVTWSNVTLSDDASGNVPGQTFQTILFQDGTIWMGYQQASQTNNTIIGLSSGSQGYSEAPGAGRTSLASIPSCNRKQMP